MNQDNSVGINSKLSEAWACRDLYVEYNDCELDESSFVDFEALFGGSSIKANLIFLDNEGFTSTLNGTGAAPQEGGIVKVGYTDCLGCPIENEYIIIKQSEQRDKREQKLVSLELVDVKSRRMSGAFKSKGYPDTKYSDAIKKHLKELKIDGVKILPKKKELKSNTIISQHQDFFETFNKANFENGYHFIQDRATSYFVAKDFLEFSKLKNDGEVFVYDTNEIAVNRIVQFHIEGFDSDVLLQNAKTETQSNDEVTVNSPDNEQGVKQATFDHKVKKSKNDANITKKTKTSEAIHQIGTKFTIKPLEEKRYFNSLKNAQKMRIWVPGRNINRIGTKCEVRLPRPKFYKQTEYDEVFSGEWEIYLVRDKIIGWYFMQEIFLRRPGS